MKSLSVTIQMKATEQYFPLVLFIMLYEVVLTYESEDEILKCDHSNTFYLNGYTLGFHPETHKLELYFPVVLFVILYKAVLTFDYMEENLSTTIQAKAVTKFITM